MLEAGAYIYKLKGAVVLRQVEDAERYWVFDTRDGGHYSVNREAYQVIESIAAEGVTGIEMLAESLAEEYEVAPQVVHEDIEQILNELLSEGIVQRRDRQ